MPQARRRTGWDCVKGLNKRSTVSKIFGNDYKGISFQFFHYILFLKDLMLSEDKIQSPENTMQAIINDKILHASLS